MSANTQVIVIEDDSSSVAPRPSSRSSIRRRKPWTPEDVEMTQLSRQALLDQIRNRRKQDYECRCREESPKQVAFGRKVLNKQLSRSVNDVREVVGQLGQMVQEYRKLSSSQVLAIPAKCCCCSCTELRVEFRPSRAHTLKDLSKTTELTSEISIAEDQAKDESKMCKVVELFEKPKSEALKSPEICKKKEDFVEEVKILKRQLSKSVNDISISGDRFGLKVVGSEKMSQIWTVPTNCGCCEPGKEGDCKRVNVQELREKFIEEMVSGAAELNIPEIPKVEDSIILDPADPAKTIEPEKSKIPTKTAELETPKVPEVSKAEEKVQETSDPKIPADPVKPTELEVSKAAEIPKEIIKESTEPLIAAIPAKTDEPEQLKASEAVTKTAELEKPKVLEVLKVEEKVQESTEPKISADPVKPVESEISKAAEDPKEVIPAKESEESKAAEIPTKPTELEASKVVEVLNAEGKVQESINLKISENPTELEKSKTAEVPKEVIPAIPAKTTEPEKTKAPEIPKTQEIVKDSTIPVIPANPPKTAEPEKPKVAEVPKPKEVVPQTAKPVIPAKPAEPPKATPTEASEVVDEDDNIIVRLLTWMGFWSTAKPTEPEATTTTATVIPAATTTTTVAKPATTVPKPATITAPITTTTAATVTVPTATTAKKESPPKPTNPTKPEDASSPEEPNWVELQVPVVPREGTAKDANEESSAKSTARVFSRLYLNVLVEVGSGLISITPVASCELLIKTRVVVWEEVIEEEDHEEAKEDSKKVESSVKEQIVDMYTGPGL